MRAPPPPITNPIPPTLPQPSTPASNLMPADPTPEMSSESPMSEQVQRFWIEANTFGVATTPAVVPVEVV